MNYNELFPKVVSHAKEYGFIFQSSEIYDGLSAVYDYGPMGVELKNNIKDAWWRSMVQMHENIVGLDTAILMHPTVWKASGHVDAFNDPLIDNKDSKKRYRADVLVEDYIEKKLQKKIDKEIAKARKRFGEDFDPEMYKETNPRVKGYVDKIKSITERLANGLEDDNLQELYQLIIDLEIADPETGSRNWSEVKQFNLMFKAQMGAVAADAMDIYMRPETAQGIFVNFLNVAKTSRQKIPFGIAQIGKAFRNEIVARQFIFRMREFEQMEMQFFVRPGTELEWYKTWKEKRRAWHISLGLNPDRLHFHEHEKMAHYANAAEDIQFSFPFGTKELEGIHSRTDFDLKQHEEFSGKKLRYYDPELKEKYIPYVVETSVGLDRTFLAHMCNALQEEEVNGETRTVLKLHPVLAPIKVAVFPLVEKDGLPEIAHDIFNRLKYDYRTHYEDGRDSIGRRYRRMDAIGTPYAITVDHDTKTDGTVTIRERDSMKQARIKIEAIPAYISERLDPKNILQ
ncbi:MAG TPA: glycine--tRNA ligase [Bacteroidetes bacterium]|nr:glycine--tRNA ligase [Bacteroidota bacterium]